jgi:hypothetical protein
MSCRQSASSLVAILESAKQISGEQEQETDQQCLEAVRAHYWDATWA